MRPIKVHSKDVGLKFPRNIIKKASVKKAKTPEATIQAQTEGYLNALGIFYIRIPDALNRVLFARGQHLSGGAIGDRKRISAYLKGLPDITVLKDGRYLAIELKVGSNKMSGAQKVWSDAIGTKLCYSFESARKEIDIFLSYGKV